MDRRILLVSVVLLLTSCTTSAKLYSWQVRCDNACAANLGDTAMANIDRTSSCILLSAMRDGGNPSRPATADFRLAVQDKLDGSHCSGFKQRVASDPYKPLYPWQ